MTLIKTADDYQTLSNENGKIPGRAGFRLTDSEVEDVFYLAASHVEDFEVTPGVALHIQGWVGGQVIDFTFGTDGALTGGKIVVGPHPESDANDVVVMEKLGFVGLTPRTPGPALRFTPGRNTRVYVNNWLVTGVGATKEETPMSLHFGFITRHDQDGAYQWSQEAFTMSEGSPYVYEFTVPAEGSHVYYDSYGWNQHLSGPAIIAEASWEHDREYVLFTQEMGMLNGNSFPGTVEQLSGWFKDTIRIKESRVDPETKDTIVTILDEPRLPYTGSNDDTRHPVLATDCPAYGGPVRYGTGCVINGIHVHGGHNIPSATFSPGTVVMIEGHGDSATASINGVHHVARESLTSFRIKKIGTEGSSGGEGGFVHIWRLHKASYQHPQLQNNGASGAYLRFNYGESILLRLFNGDDEASHIHLHGHHFTVVAENGFALGAARDETSYSLPAGNSADVLVKADNVNRVGAWMLSNDVQTAEAWTLPTPWPEAEIHSAGHTAFVDYTGFAQGTLVLNANGEAVPLSWLPPVCNVQSETLTVTRDSLGWEVGQDNHIWVFLGGEGNFETNPWTSEPWGSDVQYKWSVQSTPGSDPNFFTPQEASTYVVGLADGTYVFSFEVSGRNALQTNPSVRATCRKTVTVHVCPTAADCQNQNDLTTLPNTFVSPAITTVRLGVDAPVATAKRALKSTPAAAGHATFQLHRAGHLTRGNTLTVEEFRAVNPLNPTGAWDPQDPNPLSPLHIGRRFTFNRWANPGSNTDFWFNINPATTADKNLWSFAIRQVVFDSRVQTFGHVLAAAIGRNVAAGAQPPAHSKVYYPMWQGSSSARLAQHDVYFLILESSDEEFCAKFGCVYSPSLSLIPLNTGIVNPASLTPTGVSYRNEYIRQRKDTGTFADQRATNFHFNTDPTLIPVTSANPTNDVETSIPFAYSPLKYVSWITDAGVAKHVVANMPFVYWGNRDVQNGVSDSDLRSEGRMLLVEVDSTDNDCDRFIRGAAYRPEDFETTGWDTTLGRFIPSGPPGCGTPRPAASRRQRGGQLLESPDFRRMYAVFKTHRAAYDGKVVPYFSITDTSDLLEAQYHGVPFTPALDKLLATGSNPSVVPYRQWGNGVAGTGVLGFQDAVVSSVPLATSWTPFWQITNLYWNCGSYSVIRDEPTTETDTLVMYDILPTIGDIYLKDENIVYNPALKASSDIDSDFYQLTSKLKSTTCAGYVKSNTGSTWARSTEIANLLAKGSLFETANPPGAEPAAQRASFSILNAHIPYVFRPAAPRETEDLVLPFSISEDGFPIIPGTWVLSWKPTPADATSVIHLAYRPLVKGAEMYVQKDNDLSGDFPPPESIIAGLCPNCAWQAFYNGKTINGSPYWQGQKELPRGQRPFRLTPVTTSTITPPAVIRYSLLECNDREFAEQFNARYVADLPTAAATSSVWWTEPQPDETGRYQPSVVSAALDSFIFADVPANVGSTGGVNPIYSPLKTFTFKYRWVTCNMPFAAWGSAVASRLVTDRLDYQGINRAVCSSSIRGDMFGSKYRFFGEGPPGCAGEVHPLQRVRGGQALAWGPGDSTVTLKLHRTVNKNNGQFSYYVLWDTTNAIEAGYYGVPVAPKLALATTGVETMKIFANGMECAGCNAYDFQDPIIGDGLSPIRKVTNLLWNCNDVLRSGELFAISNLDGSACSTDQSNPMCDNYPLRANLKWVACKSYVEKFAASGVVYSTDNLTKWIADRVVFETVSPVGVSPSRAAAEVTNSPVVLTVQF